MDIVAHPAGIRGEATSPRWRSGNFPGILGNPRNPALTWESSEWDYYWEVWFPQVILGVSQSDTVKIRSRPPEYPEPYSGKRRFP